MEILTVIRVALVHARTIYYEAIVDLNFRLSPAGRKFHDGNSIRQQWAKVLKWHDYILETYGKRMELPEEPIA